MLAVRVWLPTTALGNENRPLISGLVFKVFLDQSKNDPPSVFIRAVNSNYIGAVW